MKLSFSGQNLPKQLTVKVDGQKVECKLSSEDERTLLFQSPAMNKEGFKKIELVNPSGGTAVLDNILLYTNTVSLPEDRKAPQPKQLANISKEVRKSESTPSLDTRKRSD